MKLRFAEQFPAKPANEMPFRASDRTLGSQRTASGAAARKEGGLDLAALAADWGKPETFRARVKVRDEIRSGAMPPAKQKRPPQDESDDVLRPRSRPSVGSSKTAGPHFAGSTARNWSRVRRIARPARRDGEVPRAPPPPKESVQAAAVDFSRLELSVESDHVLTEPRVPRMPRMPRMPRALCGILTATTRSDLSLYPSHGSIRGLPTSVRPRTIHSMVTESGCRFSGREHMTSECKNRCVARR